MPLKRQSRSAKSVECLISLGSNVGNRGKRLKSAVASIGKIAGVKVLKKSRVYETKPLGPSRRTFFNCALKIKTTRSAMGLLIEFKRLEVLAGRKPGLRWGPRPLDIDLIAYGSQKVKNAWLQIPHPQAVKRAFVLAPLLDIAPKAKLGSSQSLREILARLTDVPRNIKLSL